MGCDQYSNVCVIGLYGVVIVFTHPDHSDVLNTPDSK